MVCRTEEVLGSGTDFLDQYAYTVMQDVFSQVSGVHMSRVCVCVCVSVSRCFHPVCMRL